MSCMIYIYIVATMKFEAAVSYCAGCVGSNNEVGCDAFQPL